MANNPVSQELSRFIARYIHSVEQLEILCLVSSNPAKSWSVGEVLHEVQSAEQSISSCLKKFQEDGFLVSRKKEGMFQFSPTQPSLADSVRDLSKTYRERRVTIVEMIYKKPSDPIQDFAEAFRFKKDK